MHKRRFQTPTRIRIRFRLPRSDWACDDSKIRDQGGALFERSEFAPTPVFSGQRRLPRSEAKGTQAAGSPFFAYFLWRSKESE
ncbi:MAG: hypothetical protein JWR60_4363, partial [Polaromonas sp.]|nr:hypothetical protein [Polaromonas sp.]